MTTDRRSLEIHGLAVEVVRKDIKHLHLGVYPPGGRVRVAAPRRLDTEAIRLAVLSRLGWIRRQRAEFERQARQSRREFVTGESHYFEGRRYRLDVSERAGRPSVRQRTNTTLALTVRPGSDRDTREVVLHRWYRRQLGNRLPALLATWQHKAGVSVHDMRIKKMKTRWGSCNVTARRIWLNLELAKKPPACLEYILVHELIHLLEPGHTARFHDLMDSLMPHWRSCRDTLNRAPLAHADWPY